MPDAAEGAEPTFADGPLPLITSEPFEALAPQWAALHRSIAGAMPFSHPVWHEAWLRHCGTDAFPVFLALRPPAGEDGEAPLVGVIPLDVGGEAPRFLGDPDLSDHSGALVAPGHEHGAAAALVEWLMEDLASGFEAWGLPAAAPLRSALLAAAERYGWSASEEPEAVTPTVELPATWEAYQEALPKKHRHELRRKLRNLERAGEVGFVSATAPGEVAAAVEGLLAMMRESREAKAAFLTPEREALFRDLAAGLGEHGLARLSTLTLDGRPRRPHLRPRRRRRDDALQQRLRPGPGVAGRGPALEGPARARRHRARSGGRRLPARAGTVQAPPRRRSHATS